MFSSWSHSEDATLTVLIILCAQRHAHIQVNTLLWPFGTSHNSYCVLSNILINLFTRTLQDSCCNNVYIFCVGTTCDCFWRAAWQGYRWVWKLLCECISNVIAWVFILNFCMVLLITPWAFRVGRRTITWHASSLWFLASWWIIILLTVDFLKRFLGFSSLIILRVCSWIFRWNHHGCTNLDINGNLWNNSVNLRGPTTSYCWGIGANLFGVYIYVQFCEG